MRQAVSREELKEFLNRELRGRGLDCEISGPIDQLVDPDDEGCNWSDDLIIRLGDQEMNLGVVSEVVREARRRFKLVED